MRQVSVTDLKNQLSRYLRLVKKGETIEVLEHSVPVARIAGVNPAEAGAEGHLERLRRDGIVAPADRQPRPELLEQPPIPCQGDVVAAVIEGRGDR
jgi:prevent-host-death family protein